MIGKVGTFIGLAVATVLSYLLIPFYDTDPEKVYFTLLSLTIIYLVFNLISVELLSRKIRDPKAKYSFRKALSVISIALMILSVAVVWIEDSSTLILSYGLVGAAVALALQDLLKNIAGGMIILATSIYRVGDRVELHDRTGDVIDIGIFYTTLMEIGEWVDGDQPTGRLVSVPNGLVIAGKVSNFTRDHGYLWDEISLPLTYSSNWRKAVDLLTETLNAQTEAFFEGAKRDIDRIGEKYYLPSQDIRPSVYIVPRESWISLTLRYTVPVRDRRVVRDKINRLVIGMIEENQDMTIAS
jgi:small-conductance mechanosensitive channel